jgi:hypothetical protein
MDPIQRVPILQATSHLAVDFAAGNRNVERGFAQVWQASDDGWVIAFMRPPNQSFARVQRVDDFGRTGE